MRLSCFGAARGLVGPAADDRGYAVMPAGRPRRAQHDALARRAGVGGGGARAALPHEARHCCASYLAAAGLTPKEAQTAMGHADIRTTLNVYAKAVRAGSRASGGLLDAYLDGPGARQSRDS